MPFLPSKQKGEAAFLVDKKQEIFEVFTYLARKMAFTHYQILDLPHNVYLAYLKHNHIYDLEQTELGREYLEKVRRYQNPRKHPDLSAIRNFGGYQAIERGDS